MILFIAFIVVFVFVFVTFTDSSPSPVHRLDFVRTNGVETFELREETLS